MSLQKYTSKARKDFKMRILYAENLTLVLRELWQELENLISCMGKLCNWEMQYPFHIHF